MSRDQLTRALIGIEPLPTVVAKGGEYSRRPNGEWVRLDARDPRRIDLWIPAGSAFALVLDTLLQTPRLLR